MLIVVIWWFVSARKWFKGPKVNLEHLMHGREDQAADIKKAEVHEDSSSDDNHIPGSMPEGYQVGDMKPHGL